MLEEASESEYITSTANSEADEHEREPDVPLPWPCYRRHDHDASIVFVGPRATGVSSIAVVAGSILGWKIVDCDGEFEKITGSTKQQFRSTHGAELYRQRKLDVVKELLHSNAQRCVFACGSIISRKKNAFFTRYAREHPVVYVMRERTLIQDYLGMTNDEAWENAVEHMHLFFRQRSNYDFYNLNEAEEPRWQTTLTKFLEEKSRASSQAASPQVLRKTRAHVSTLLRNIFGSTSRTKRYADIQTFPESDPELRQGAMGCCIDLDHILNDSDYLSSLDTGADAVQLNITGSSHAFLSQDILAWAVAVLRRKLDIPVILHVPTSRLSSDAVSANVPQGYGLLLHLLLRLAPEYLTIDLRSGDRLITQVAQLKGLTRIMGCFHVNHSLQNMEQESILAQYHRARRLGCDLVSFSGVSGSMYDNIVCQQISHSVKQLGLDTPALVYSVGPLGRLSQVLNPLMTPVIPDGQSWQSMPTMGLTSARQIRQAWHMLVPVKRSDYYVVGAEVRQSLSPALHNAGFKSCGLPFTYQVRESTDFSTIKAISAQHSFGGASISFPFKAQVLALTVKQSVAVQRIGAANTLLPLSNYSRGLEDGHKLPEVIESTDLIAENTDWMGIHVCIAKHCTPANHATRESSALVIGAGGTARAAIYALIRLGFGHIWILNRSKANANSMKEHFEHSCIEVEETARDSTSPPPRATHNPIFHVLESCEDPWPAECSLLSVIVCAIPAQPTADIPEYPAELPHDWFNNSTGGLIADVSSFQM